MTPTFVIFGASGDLTGRYLVPAVAALLEAGALPEGFRIVGVARDAWDDARFRSHLNLNCPGQRLTLRPVDLAHDLAAAYEPYALLLLEIRGDPALSIRADEAEESWRIVDPIVTAFARGRPPLLVYPPGSDGPPGSRIAHANGDD